MYPSNSPPEVTPDTIEKDASTNPYLSTLTDNLELQNSSLLQKDMLPVEDDKDEPRGQQNNTTEQIQHTSGVDSSYKSPFATKAE